uniref:Endothelial differentiation factor n=1 Tax=Echinococcus granulosus TaxID=6210 RepID=A0A068WEG1_ECHGR|nr:endothelial differentiation factor [Echinococcus granulosus]
MSARPVNLRDNATINAATRQGIEIQTEKKWAAGSNKQHANPKNISKLDEETEDFHHATISLDVGRLIMQGRQDANLTQKELATKINEKPQVSLLLLSMNKERRFLTKPSLLSWSVPLESNSAERIKALLLIKGQRNSFMKYYATDIGKNQVC